MRWAIQIEVCVDESSVLILYRVWQLTFTVLLFLKSVKTFSQYFTFWVTQIDTRAFFIVLSFL